jgi:hypothetical protein
MAESIKLFLPNGEADSFCKGGWTRQTIGLALICPSGKALEDYTVPCSPETAATQAPSLLPIRSNKCLLFEPKLTSVW